ncbi:MAG: response regulator [Bradyrhizobium sp.]|uniref:response regulator n=1 Tax=Bradyrhizobium sp. TaxID=376 RepID=UPI001D6F1104|nr:response regulator [Bradyrhizobium sp.]MBV9558998.1 response regulator [Bradyrhizobium sp.]
MSSSVAELAVAPLAGRRVLIVEDEYFLADDLAHALRALGAEIIGPTGEFNEARQFLNISSAIDGALLDINLRNEMIFPLARELRVRRVPFTFTTGYDRTSLPSDLRDVPIWEKPLNIQAVARSLADDILRR